MKNADLNKVKKHLQNKLEYKLSIIESLLSKIEKSTENEAKRLYFQGQVSLVNDLKKEVEKMTVKAVLLS